MPIIDLYSKRKKRAEKGNQPDIYQYNDLSMEFRRQVICIWRDAIGVYQDTGICSSGMREFLSSKNKFVNKLWGQIFDQLSRELGLDDINSFNSIDPFEKSKAFLLNKNTSIDNLLDLIELTFKSIDTFVREELAKPPGSCEISVSQQPDESIIELNHRFREHEIGYQFESGQIIRVDSKFIHAEVVVPALGLLSDPNFAGPEQEFRSAHEHYRRQEYKDAIVDSLNSFESTIKAICEVREWEYPKTATAQKLIEVIFAKELIPKYLQTHFSSLKSVLEAGVPTVRNKTSGHGQGATPVDVPEYLAVYVLHLTASNIVMLIEAHKAQP